MKKLTLKYKIRVSWLNIMSTSYETKKLERCINDCCYRIIHNKPFEFNTNVTKIFYQRIESCTKLGCSCNKYNRTCKIYYQNNTLECFGFRVCEPEKLLKDELKNINDKYLSTNYTGKIFCHYNKVECTYCDQLGKSKCHNCYGNKIVGCTRCNESGQMDVDIMDGSSMIIGSEKQLCTKCRGDGKNNCFCGTGYVLCRYCRGKLHYFVDINGGDCCVIL